MDRLRKELLPEQLADLQFNFGPRLNDNYIRKMCAGSERVVCVDETNGTILWIHR